MRVVDKDIMNEVLADNQKVTVKETKPVSKETPLDEGFRAEKTVLMLQKMMAIISRKIRKPFLISPCPDYYQNKLGLFRAFFVKIGTTQVLRFNFKKRETSEDIFSMDYYAKIGPVPTYTVQLLGYNIVEVMDYLVDVITGAFFKYSEEALVMSDKQTLFEATSYKQALASWLEANPPISAALRSAANNRTQFPTVVDSYLDSYNTYLGSIGMRPPSSPVSNTRFLIRQLFNETGVPNDIPGVLVAHGTQDTIVSPSSEQESVYNELRRNAHLLKFKAMNVYCQRIKAGDPNFQSVYIYGDGGVGKSFTVKNILGPLPNCVYSKAKLQGYTGLLRILFDHKEGKILVLDDVLTDKEMNNPNIGTILKCALEMGESRRIQLVRGQLESTHVNPDAIRLSESEFDEVTSYMKTQRLTEIETPVIDVTAPLEGIYDFPFASTVVFITNFKNIPQPVEDRCWVIKLELTNRQILDLIHKSLTEATGVEDLTLLDQAYLATDIAMSKQEAYEIMSAFDASGVPTRKMSFRAFNRVTALMGIGINDPKLLKFMIGQELGVFS